MLRDAPKPTVTSIQLLSGRGSTRATRYSGTNKIVTLDRKTHIAWLDSISDTIVATYDHDAGSWTSPIKVGSGHDNHAGPALTCDSEGYLHVFFGPHGQAPFQHYRSTRPDNSTQWMKLTNVGTNATYPSVVYDDEDTLHLIYRGGERPRQPFKLLYQRKRKGSVWSRSLALAKAPDHWKGYTHYHAALTIAPDDTLHIAYNIYYDGRAQCAGHMMSRDRGQRWTLADGSPLSLPATVETNAFFEQTDEALKVNSIVCDSKGQPWISVSLIGSENTLKVYCQDGSTWHALEPGKLTWPEIVSEELSHDSGVFTIDKNDRLYMSTCIKGHVALLYSASQGKQFQLLPIFPPDAVLPHVGVTAERPTGHHAVDVPFLLFSTGEKGPDCFGKGIFHKVRAVQLS